MKNQRLWFLTAILCATSASSIASAADPPAPAPPDESVAAQAKALGVAVKRNAQEVAKTVKVQAKKVAVAAQQGAKEVQATVTHHIKNNDDNKTEDSTRPAVTPVH